MGREAWVDSAQNCWALETLGHSSPPALTEAASSSQPGVTGLRRTGFRFPQRVYTVLVLPTQEKVKSGSAGGYLCDLQKVRIVLERPQRSGPAG